MAFGLSRGQSALMDGLFFLIVCSVATLLLLSTSSTYGMVSNDALLREYRFKYAHYTMSSILHDQNVMRPLSNDLALVRGEGMKYSDVNFSNECPIPQLSPCNGKDMLQESLNKIYTLNPSFGIEVSIFTVSCEERTTGYRIGRVYSGDIGGSSYSAPSFFVSQVFKPDGDIIPGALACYRIIVSTSY
jgi:hypothetical protein